MEITITHPTDKANYSIVELGRLSLAFSYKTCIGYNTWEGHGWQLSVNLWGPTTGRHLNALDANADRLPRDLFEQQLAEVLAAKVGA